MHVVLWDTRKLDVSKDFAGGMGIGQYAGQGGVRGRIVRYFYKRDHRPTSLLLAYLAAIFRQLGHRVEYCEDRTTPGADLYVFCPSLITLAMERAEMARLRAENPRVPIIIAGTVASVLPQAFDGLEATIVKGEAEQLLWKLDEVLNRPGATVQLGTIEDLDRLPLPDWSPFGPGHFRIGYDFWRFPTALVQSSRGCAFGCNYCPYIALENAVRFREPEAVGEEIRYGMQRWGFRSFKFRDPLFGVDSTRVFRLAEILGRLPRKIQFSIETRIELMRPEILRALQRVGLTSLTVGVETPSDETLRRYRRVPISDDRQREFLRLCRGLGLRTVAGFMIGFPGDTVRSIRNVLSYAKELGPTFANFNIVTPYPGTEFYEQIKDRIAVGDFSRYDSFTPVLKYDHLSAQQITELHAWCMRRYYFRWQYLRENASLLWPGLRRFGVGPTARGRRSPPAPASQAPHQCPALRRKGLRQDSPHSG